ncbi:unnamed protein product [Sympodiomycopsis kandeliae]
MPFEAPNKNVAGPSTSTSNASTSKQGGFKIPQSPSLRKIAAPSPLSSPSKPSRLATSPTRIGISSPLTSKIATRSSNRLKTNTPATAVRPAASRPPRKSNISPSLLPKSAATMQLRNRKSLLGSSAMSASPSTTSLGKRRQQREEEDPRPGSVSPTDEFGMTSTPKQKHDKSSTADSGETKIRRPSPVSSLTRSRSDRKFNTFGPSMIPASPSSKALAHKIARGTNVADVHAKDQTGIPVSSTNRLRPRMSLTEVNNQVNKSQSQSNGKQASRFGIPSRVQPKQRTGTGGGGGSSAPLPVSKGEDRPEESKTDVVQFGSIPSRSRGFSFTSKPPRPAQSDSSEVQKENTPSSSLLQQAQVHRRQQKQQNIGPPRALQSRYFPHGLPVADIATRSDTIVRTGTSPAEGVKGKVAKWEKERGGSTAASESNDTKSSANTRRRSSTAKVGEAIVAKNGRRSSTGFTPSRRNSSTNANHKSTPTPATGGSTPPSEVIVQKNKRLSTGPSLATQSISQMNPFQHLPNPCPLRSAAARSPPLLHPSSPFADETIDLRGLSMNDDEDEQEGEESPIVPFGKLNLRSNKGEAGEGEESPIVPFGKLNLRSGKSDADEDEWVDDSCEGIRRRKGGDEPQGVGSAIGLTNVDTNTDGSRAGHSTGDREVPLMNDDVRSKSSVRAESSLSQDLHSTDEEDRIKVSNQACPSKPLVPSLAPSISASSPPIATTSSPPSHLESLLASQSEQISVLEAKLSASEARSAQQSQLSSEHVTILENALQETEERLSKAESIVDLSDQVSDLQLRLDKMQDEHDNKLKEQEQSHLQLVSQLQSELESTKLNQEKQMTKQAEKMNRLERKYTEMKSLHGHLCVEKSLSAYNLLSNVIYGEVETIAEQMDMCKILLGNLEGLESRVKSGTN